MDWNVITSIITMLCGGSIVSVITLFLNRKSDKRKLEAQADHEQATADHEQATAELEKFRGWEVQIERMNNQIEIKDNRIEKLNQQLAEKEERFQKQMEEYRDQTRRLRECQDRGYEDQLEIKRLNAHVIELTSRVGELEADRLRHKCIKEHCPFKEPATDLTIKARNSKQIAPTEGEIPTSDPQPELTAKQDYDDENTY